MRVRLHSFIYPHKVYERRNLMGIVFFYSSYVFSGLSIWLIFYQKCNSHFPNLFLLTRYNYVTPLTSLVVIRPEDREEIEKELKEEEEKEIESIKEKKKMKEASKFVHLKKIRRPRPEALAYSGVPRSGAAGFYGDPHFVIPLRQSNLNLCFNWDGEEGDVSASVYCIKHPVTPHTTWSVDSGIRPILFSLIKTPKMNKPCW